MFGMGDGIEVKKWSVGGWGEKREGGWEGSSWFCF